MSSQSPRVEACASRAYAPGPARPLSGSYQFISGDTYFCVFGSSARIFGMSTAGYPLLWP